MPSVDLELEKKEVKDGLQVFIQTDSKEELILACPGDKNKLRSQKTWRKKKQNTGSGTPKLIVFPIGRMECTERLPAVIDPSGHSCAKTGTQMEIGFQVGKDLVPLMSLCHDLIKADTLYVEHDLPSKICEATYFEPRPDFQEGPLPLYKDVPLKLIYTKEYQKKLFEELMGSELSEPLLTGKYFLARGHLAPKADFYYATWKWSTFFYANAAPQWQIINAGNWKSLENYVRKVAAKTGEDLRIITGTFGVLKMYSPKSRSSVEVLLHSNKVRVPAAFFKIIQSKATNKAIVAICSNDPFATKDTAPKELCKDIAAQNSWPDDKKEFSKGRIYFCDVGKFLKQVQTAPKISYKGILQGIEESLNPPTISRVQSGRERLERCLHSMLTRSKRMISRSVRVCRTP
ncbi:salivary protein Tsal2A isoform X2 [Bemisia tabaci]